MNAPARHGVHLDLYTGDTRSVYESLFSSTDDAIESPNHAWAVKHGEIHRTEDLNGWVYLDLYRKPWFGRGLCISYSIFDVVRQIRQHEVWSEEEKVARLKEYHADVNARKSNWPPGALMRKWNRLIWPKEPNPRIEADAAMPSDGDASGDE